MIVAALRDTLPRGYFAEPWIRLGTRREIDVPTDLPAQDVYEVKVYDEKRHSRLVAAVEIVSPANKDRPESRLAFIGKCAGPLWEHVSVVIVDPRGEPVRRVARPDGPSRFRAQAPNRKPLCQCLPRDATWRRLATRNLGRAACLGSGASDDLAVPLELEKSYEDSCRILGIP